jgi:hypothetical protein
MSQYVAVLRLSEGARIGATGSGAEPRLLRLAGVESVQLDRVAGALLIWFNRGQVSLADLVRAVEDAGVAVAGVAQGRADVGEQARVAIA